MSEQQIIELERDIEEKRRALDATKVKLDAARRNDRLERTRALRPLAELAHDLLCMYNHTDGCAWGYEQGKGDADEVWERQAHRRWLEKVEAIAKLDLSEEGLRRALEQFREIKESCPRVMEAIGRLRQL